jgi:hypothetical protein
MNSLILLTALLSTPSDGIPITDNTITITISDNEPTPITQESKSVEGLKRLSIRERDKLGFTFRNIRKTTERLVESGEIDPKTMSRAEIAATVFSEISSTIPPESLKEYEAVDWDAVLAFIEKVLPLILQIIAIFAS